MDLEIRNKRFLSLDVFRGIAILGVVVVHALIFGVFSTIDTALNILPLPMLIILSPVVIFAPMAGLFVFISSMSNGMVVQKRLNQGYSIQTAIQPILITGLALLILHFIFPLLFNHSNTSMFHPEATIDAMIPASITQGLGALFGNYWNFSIFRKVYCGGLRFPFRFLPQKFTRLRPPRRLRFSAHGLRCFCTPFPSTPF